MGEEVLRGALSEVVCSCSQVFMHSAGIQEEKAGQLSFTYCAHSEEWEPDVFICSLN